jgi:hypothetical protein
MKNSSKCALVILFSLESSWINLSTGTPIRTGFNAMHRFTPGHILCVRMLRLRLRSSPCTLTRFICLSLALTRCAPAQVPFTLSLNGQQQIPVQLQFRFDNTFGFLLMAGSVGLFGLLILTCCSYSCYSFYNMADYRTLLSPEYLELTGKTRWRVIKDIISARGASERQELVRVLEKLKQVQNKPQSRWKSAVGATLNARSQNADSGWDKLLAGDFEGSAATAVAQPAQSLEKKGKTGWTSIVNKTEVGSGPRARSATATAAASKWAASASLKQS